MLETLYYIGFCLLIIFVIVYSLKFDDHLEFHTDEIKKQRKNAERF
ncbi:hypothetical protein [Kordiimonas sp. SCSIO 12610]|nr:hypothetical protein [Kordiimonas sp. SCSIO 12610]UTW54158.1 hypothetical protein KFF44_09985 [Kordiimonas sp. SCSIO 12610]